MSRGSSCIPYELDRRPFSSQAKGVQGSRLPEQLTVRPATGRSFELRPPPHPCPFGAPAKGHPTSATRRHGEWACGSGGVAAVAGYGDGISGSVLAGA